MSISEQESYFLGLITGRGHIYKDSFRIAIEFSHANKYVAKIFHCDACGNLVTGFTVKMKCKGCGKTHSKEDTVKLEQIESTKESLNSTIIPFLESEIKADFNIVANPSITLLVADFSKYHDEFTRIVSQFSGIQSFDSFYIPKVIQETTKDNKVEFVNGLLDTAGFNNAGGWMPRNGRNAHGRMRSYFQIVRNWHMPVEIDNFLREHFDLPIQTIDWGHPNIRDSGLADYYKHGPTTWSREHQVKFFPEYYKQFKFRIGHKQELFEDLIAHNEFAGFVRKEDWFKPSKIKDSDLKPYHPGETDARIPSEARRHFDKFWQINAAMGCKFLKSVAYRSNDKEYYFLTGDEVTSGDVARLEKERHIIRQSMTDNIHAQYAANQAVQKKKATTRTAARTNPEQALYEPLTRWYKSRLQKMDSNAQAFDVSSGNLNQFISRNSDLAAVFDFCNNYRIKPDIVGFLPATKNMAFIEAKVTSLTLKELGQLLGYCYVAQPVNAWLVSIKAPSPSMVRILQANPALLEYMPSKRIQLGTWNGTDVVEVKI